MNNLADYHIQQWLFHEADGKFEIDLAESGIQHHFVRDLKINPDVDLNYSKDQGQFRLREKLAELYNSTAEKILISHGSQEALYLLYRSLLVSGDHVIVTQPGWQQSWEIPKIVGCSVSFLKLKHEEDYEFNIKNLEMLIQKNTKALILNFPNNPTGRNLTVDQWEQVIQLSRKHNLWIINDEEYFIDYGNSIVHRYKKSVIVSGLSKVYGFPGLRIGWLVSNKEIVEKVTNYKRYVTVCNSSLCEDLAYQVLSNKDVYLARYFKMVQEGLDLLKSWIKPYDQLKLVEPSGTPYAYIRLPQHLDSNSFVTHLLEQERVLVMPAEVFEDRGAFRLTFGRDLKVLKEGLDRISRVLHVLER